MPVRFLWCHDEDCPNFGRARQRDVEINKCEICGGQLHFAEPDNVHEEGYDRA